MYGNSRDALDDDDTIPYETAKREIERHAGDTAPCGRSTHLWIRADDDWVLVRCTPKHILSHLGY